MPSQRDITLRSGHATPKNIVLHDLPVAPVVTTPIYLYSGHASPKNITLRDPTDAPDTGGAEDVAAAGAIAFALGDSGSAVVESPVAVSASLGASVVGASVIERPASALAACVVSVSGAPVPETTASAIAACALSFTGAAQVEVAPSAPLSLALSVSASTITDHMLSAGAQHSLLPHVHITTGRGRRKRDYSGRGYGAHRRR